VSNLEDFERGVQRIWDRGEFDLEEDVGVFGLPGPSLLAISGEPSNPKMMTVGLIPLKGVKKEHIEIMEGIGIEVEQGTLT
jgi:hypothetical protein